jgi:hypothetical protein
MGKSKEKKDQEARINAASSSFGDIAKTGGYSEDDKTSFRARAMSPIRSAYSNAMMNINRQKALQGGYSPNYGALQAKMAREQGQSMSDAQQGINLNLGQAILGNKMQGAQGLAGLPMAPEGGFGHMLSGIAKFGANALTSRYGAPKTS